MDRFKKLLLEQFKLALEDGELGFTALYVKVEHEDVFIQFVIDFLSFGVCVSLDFSESSVKGSDQDLNKLGYAAHVQLHFQGAQPFKCYKYNIDQLEQVLQDVAIEISTIFREYFRITNEEKLKFEVYHSGNNIDFSAAHLIYFGRYKDAIKILLEELEELKEVKGDELQKDATRVFSFIQLGISYDKIEQSTKALEYYEKSKLIASKVGNEVLCQFLDDLISKVSIYFFLRN